MKGPQKIHRLFHFLIKVAINKIQHPLFNCRICSFMWTYSHIDIFNELKEKDILKSECLNQLYYSVRLLLGSDSISASFDSTGLDTFFSLLVRASSSLFPHTINSKTNKNDDVILNYFNHYHLIIILSTSLCTNKPSPHLKFKQNKSTP